MDSLDTLTLIWKCLSCGEIIPCKDTRCTQPPDNCPSCGAPREELTVVEED